MLVQNPMVLSRPFSRTSHFVLPKQRASIRMAEALEEEIGKSISHFQRGDIQPREVDAVHIADNADLVELGLGSLEMMRLLSRWRRDGFAVSCQVLATDPTLNAWEQHFVMLERDGTDAQREPRHD